MKHAVVTGAGGFIGGHLIRGLHQRDWRAEPMTREQAGGQMPLPPADVLFHLAGLAHAGAVQADRERMFAVNVEQTVALYRRAVAAGVGKFVWLSSIKVLGDSSREPLTVTAPRRPGDLYAASKAAAEEALLAEPVGATELCIVRPPLVYGAGVKANFAALLRAAASGWPLPLRSANAPRAWVGVGNLVDMLCALAAAPSAAPRIWHVRDHEESSVAQMLGTMRELLGQPLRLWPVNPGMALGVGRLIGRGETVSRLFLPLRVDMCETQKSLGWQPPNSQRQELHEVLDWFRTR